MKTRMWVFETDRYGATDNKFFIDEPVHVPRLGEFVENTPKNVFGYVTTVQHNYIQDETVLVINVYLGEKQ
jgi:hypothetical protein